MRILVAHPPMFERINAVFPSASNPGVIFTWGSVIFNPSGGKVTRELVAHEEIHAERQGTTESDIIDWWNRYLVDPGFRLDEELPAHQAEYRAYCRRHGSGREKYLAHVASRLSGPLYGGLVNLREAKNLVMGV